MEVFRDRVTWTALLCSDAIWKLKLPSTTVGTGSAVGWLLFELGLEEFVMV